MSGEPRRESEGGSDGAASALLIASFIDFKEHHQVAQSRDNITHSWWDSVS